MHRDEFRHGPAIPTWGKVSGMRRQEGQALRRSLNAVASLLHDSKEPAFVVDREGRIVHWNQPAEAFFGVSGGDAVGRHCATVVRGLSSVGEIQCTTHCPLLVRAQRDDSYVVSEMRVPRQPRPARWSDVRLHHVPLEDESGRFSGILHVITAGSRSDA
jgi:PAS domain S-box-containing protein